MTQLHKFFFSSLLVTCFSLGFSHLIIRSSLFIEFGALNAILTSKNLSNQNHNLKYRKTLELNLTIMCGALLCDYSPFYTTNVYMHRNSKY